MSAATDDYNRGGFIAFIATMIFTFILIGYLSFVYQGVDIDKVRAKQAASNPLAKAGAGAGQQVDVSGNKTPWVTSPGMIAHGKSAYQSNCGFCHGNSGKGDGPAGATLSPKPRNFIEGKWKADGSTIGLFKTIKSGMAGTAMAAFGHVPVLDRWAIVHYIQSITKNKVVSDATKLESFAKTEK